MPGFDGTTVPDGGSNPPISTSHNIMSEESHSERTARHLAHQEMLMWHKWRKSERRWRHRNGWNRYKPIPITLI